MPGTITAKYHERLNWILVLCLKQPNSSLMSEEQLKSFLEKVKTDTSLQEKLKGAADADAALAIAK